VIGYYHVLAM